LKIKQIFSVSRNSQDPYCYTYVELIRINTLPSTGIVKRIVQTHRRASNRFMHHELENWRAPFRATMH